MSTETYGVRFQKNNLSTHPTPFIQQNTNQTHYLPRCSRHLHHSHFGWVLNFSSSHSWMAGPKSPPLPAMTFDLTWLLLEHTKGGGRGTCCPSRHRNPAVCAEMGKKKWSQCWLILWKETQTVRMMSSQLGEHPVIFAAVSPPSLAESTVTGAVELKKKVPNGCISNCSSAAVTSVQRTAHSKDGDHLFTCDAPFVCLFVPLRPHWK